VLGGPAEAYGQGLGGDVEIRVLLMPELDDLVGLISDRIGFHGIDRTFLNVKGLDGIFKVQYFNIKILLHDG